MTCWVCDTAPLIFLAKLDRLDLLRHAADEVMIPSAVLDEAQAHADIAADRITHATESWLAVGHWADGAAVELLLADLDLGEAEVLVLAKQVHADRVVLDDLDAPLCAPGRV